MSDLDTQEDEIINIHIEDKFDEENQTDSKNESVNKIPSSSENVDIELSSTSQQPIQEQKIENKDQIQENKEVQQQPKNNQKKSDFLDELFTNPHENPKDESEDIQINDETNENQKKVAEEDSEKKQEDNRAKLLAERLRQKAKIEKPKKNLSFSIDLSEESTDSFGLKIVVPQKKKRQLFKEQMIEAHSIKIKEDINEAPNQEIQEEEYEVEEEEEEDRKEDEEKVKNKELAKTVLEELQKEEDEDNKENLTDEQLEHRLYERIVEMRLSEDLEEIKKIIRIITGQWRSGKLKFGDIAEGLEKAFEGNEEERKELETKRMMRKQRKQKRNEERARKLTQESITQLIERAMWIKAGQEENASASDIIRGEMARLSDNDPRKAIMERLEMEAFVQEERAKNALKERRISKNHQMQKVERSNSSRENSFSKITFKSSQISKQHTFSFSTGVDKSNSKSINLSPQKSDRKPIKKVDKKFADFLNKINK